MNGQLNLFGEEESKKTNLSNTEIEIENIESDDEEDKKKDNKKQKKDEYEGKVVVKVYGEEVLTFEKLKVNENTLEEIRLKLVNELKYPEFSKERTIMSFDKTTGIVVPVISFQKKG